MPPRSGLYHHYVPRFILRYFAAHKRTRYVIDGDYGEILESAKAMSNWIFKDRRPHRGT
ncbi:hypothetical protein AURDEDRAFT_172064 [Auricularia subglabra TFB-10046 SS5]|nr:hypothetical protein AURDEDRAFT_172064 [Auricularia subglabra TFB-10046 SS5]